MAKKHKVKKSWTIEEVIILMHLAFMEGFTTAEKKKIGIIRNTSVQEWIESQL